MQSFRFSKYTFYFCALFLFVSTFFTKRWNEPNNAVLSWDAADYYLYLPAFFYDDLGKINNANEIIDKYNPFGCNFEDANSKVNDNYIIKYTCGIAIMELPAFIAAHYWAKIANYPVDGFSLPYQICINFWSIAFAVFGLWILRKTLIKYFDDTAISITLLILCFASNLYNFTAFSGNMSHGYLFTLYALLLFYIDRFYEKPSYKTSVILGFISGLAVLTRPTEIVCLILIALWKVSSLSDIKKRFSFIKNHFALLIAFSIAAILTGSIQLIYWKIYSGHWIYWSYGQNETFNFLHPHILDGLFSYKKGWFVYTPVMLLSVIGFYFLYKYFRLFFLPILLYFTFNIYFVFSWDCWWYGGSFSQRSVVQSYAVLAFSIAALIQSFQKRKFLFLLTSAFIILCIWLNLLMTYQAYSSGGIMENENMSKKYFWKIFGKTSINKSDKKFIDLRDELPKKLQSKLSVIYETDFEKDNFGDSCTAYSGGKGILLNKSKQESKEITIPVSSNKKGYYRASVKVFANEMEWDVWKQAQWVIALYDDEKEVRTNYYRVYRIIEPNTWQDITIDIKTPKNKDYNALKIKFWNAESDKKLIADDLKVSFAEN